MNIIVSKQAGMSEIFLVQYLPPVYTNKIIPAPVSKLRKCVSAKLVTDKLRGYIGVYGATGVDLPALK